MRIEFILRPRSTRNEIVARLTYVYHTLQIIRERPAARDNCSTACPHHAHIMPTSPHLIMSTRTTCSLPQYSYYEMIHHIMCVNGNVGDRGIPGPFFSISERTYNFYAMNLKEFYVLFRSYMGQAESKCSPTIRKSCSCRKSHSWPIPPRPSP
jgi:hypothetical protein